MAFIFDHLTAVLVGATLLGGLFLLQVRGQQTAIEAAQRYRVQTQTASFAQVVERDVENIRTQAQAEAAFEHYRFTLRQATGTDGTVYTAQAAFVTLRDPALGAASPAVLVSYDVQPTGRTLDVGGQLRPTYRVWRRVYDGSGSALVEEGGAEDVVDFDLTALMNDGSEITHRGGSPTWTGAYPSEVPSLPRAVRVEIVWATSAVQRAEDQQATAETNASRQQRTVSLVAYGSTGGLPPVPTGAPAPDLRLPGDADRPAPPTPTPGDDDDGGGTDDDDDGGGGGTDDPAPTPRPVPGGGVEI